MPTLQANRVCPSLGPNITVSVYFLILEVYRTAAAKPCFTEHGRSLGRSKVDPGLNVRSITMNSARISLIRHPDIFSDGHQGTDQSHHHRHEVESWSLKESRIF